MKQLILITILSIFLLSCENNYIRNNDLIPVENPQKETTVEILNKIDTTDIYYIYTENETLYLIQSDMVKYKVVDYSGGIIVVVPLLFILCVLLWIIAYYLELYLEKYLN